MGLMQTLLRSRLSRMPHGRHIKEERKEIKIGNFPLDGSSQRTGDAAFTPPRPMTYSTREPTPTHTTHTTRNTREYNKMNFCFMQKALSPARHVLEDTSHQTRPKIDSGDAFLLMGILN
jgi:hypothetical protein